jgi:hypothetical protein
MLYDYEMLYSKWKSDIRHWKKMGPKVSGPKCNTVTFYFIHEVVHMMKQACEGHSEPYTFTLDDPKHLHNTL